MKRINLFCGWLSAYIIISLKRKWFLTFVVIICALIMLFKWGIVCVSLQPQLYLKNICKSHANGKSVGNLCTALCQDESIKSLSCHNFYMGKEVVFSGMWDNISVVFKLPKLATVDVTDDLRYDMFSDNAPSEDEFANMIKTNIKLKFNILINDIDAKKLTYFQFKQGSYPRHIEMANIWLLAQDNEYVAVTLYDKYDLFPKLVGSCGSLFGVQQLHSISGFTHLLTIYDTRDQWKNRVKIAIKIIDYLRVLETAPSGPLHMCDVKMSHFGLSNDYKKIKYLDLDSVHPHSIVNNLTGDGSHCVDHNDCDFYDCRSFCNLITLKCEYGVANNNLQIVCEKIFLGWALPGRMIIPGLLLGAHTPESLVTLLESCANPAKESGKPRSSTPPDIEKRLHDFLVQLSLG